MKCRLFTLTSALSLLLCAALCALWVRSYWAQDEMPVSGGEDAYALRSRHGMLRLGNEHLHEAFARDMLALSNRYGALGREFQRKYFDPMARLQERQRARRFTAADGAEWERVEAEGGRIGAAMREVTDAQSALPRPTSDRRVVVVPHLVPALWLAMPPAAWLALRRARRRGADPGRTTDRLTVAAWVLATASVLVVLPQLLLWVYPPSQAIWRTALVGAFLLAATCYFAGWPAYVHATRRRLGRCVRCGYDLRASPERCPECGNTPAGRAGVLASGPGAD